LAGVVGRAAATREERPGCARSPAPATERRRIRRHPRWPLVPARMHFRLPMHWWAHR